MRVRIRDGYYHVKIKGSGSDLVVLHGFTGSADSWSRFQEQLQDQYRIIAIDLPGHGQTEVPLNEDYISMECVCDDIKSILKHLSIYQAAFLGYSMGGRTALAFSVRYPEMITSLILESASPGLRLSEERAQRRKQDQELAEFIEREGVSTFTDRWESIPLFASQKSLPDEQKKIIREQRLSNVAEGLSASLRWMGTGQQLSYWERLTELHMPVLLLTGEYDSKFNQIAGEMMKYLPDGRHEVILSAGHAIQVEQPEKFDTIVREFLIHHVN
ncbi:2-succinyl-6-hydroxy-2,4-cyclohexadiene-1-carboxylate synthase [Jeotgalibacillus sp. R-1-5s-1]|uniref:2-succinyl-6-hydroxy-2, 4-cyclohexadiene-1-carboxylate synthase n=1 Tax=Jeotgalibacillus sp. R-1-5s-1 TaxID=2555897 RepID=UPI001069D77F|nr:2-succinyl-6-hydroxy-2,4-cyclohexadiene-1-carboxylate synthase [Jeotgalibacillus sp. R-1-5s-1]TFD98144.1 2-succinyl-6-hydroxy-2,4-cyclohexadiene-1-carboxylate synthase [Jeotgalibacillus sp. R-1-5s-1]